MTDLGKQACWLNKVFKRAETAVAKRLAAKGLMHADLSPLGQQLATYLREHGHG